MFKAVSIIKKDMKVLCRSSALPVVVSVTAGVLCVMAMSGIFGIVGTMRHGMSTGYGSFLSIYATVVSACVAGVLFIAPGVMAGSVAAERKAGTLDLMRSAGLSPLNIVLGKLFSAFLPVALVLAGCLPMLLLPLLYGGVSVAGVIEALLVLMIMALCLLSAGLYFSSRSKSITAAAGCSYAFLLALTAGTLLAAFLLRRIPGGNNPAVYLLVLNPVYPAVALLSLQTGQAGTLLRLLGELNGAASGLLSMRMIMTGLAVQVVLSVCFAMMAVAEVAKRS